MTKTKHFAVVTLVLGGLVACGGSGLSASSRDASQGTGGVSLRGSGGSAGTGGVFISLSVGGFSGSSSRAGNSGTNPGAVVIDAGITICVCDFAPLPACDQSTLWWALKTAGGHTVGAMCFPTQDPPLDGGDAIFGYVVLDGDGQVVDNTSFGPFEDQQKQGWLASLVDKRWPCFGGERIAYACTEGE